MSEQEEQSAGPQLEWPCDLSLLAKEQKRGFVPGMETPGSVNRQLGSYRRMLMRPTRATLTVRPPVLLRVQAGVAKELVKIDGQPDGVQRTTSAEKHFAAIYYECYDRFIEAIQQAGEESQAGSASSVDAFRAGEAQAG